PGMESVAAAAAPHATVVQEDRLGTGHAVAMARPLLGDYLCAAGIGDVLVVYGDTPLLTPETLQAMRAARHGGAGALGADIVGLAFRPEDPAQYGRVLLDDSGAVARIVEYADANDEERAVDLCNAGALLAAGPALDRLLAGLKNDNAKGEYYLTDIYALARAQGLRAVMALGDAEEVLGVNNRQELAGAEAILQDRLRAKAMAAGVTMTDPATVYLAYDTELGQDVVLQPNVFFGPGVRVAAGAEIRANCHLEGDLEKNALVEVGPGVQVGPFARLRPGTRLAEGCRIGNFVEVKNATLKSGAKANHLTYIGDSEVGAGANVGAGTITCNYDGFNKFRTKIGDGAFIGSNTALVAPVQVGAGAIVGAGSTVTFDVEDNALAVARGRQANIKDGALRFRATASKQGKPGAKK
ncbi:MAG TPA: bifunctional UDP-N-acetylglucosamine diphosphorylase/glucosamine-1-phosphate N-acetyltransferase GlmU, partial [Kiloniellaceae bacterium]|nr:bifunctional UDP-N-acetylglucosamine diphosphorylase/glucosamine-1-phosphate N-acetyltransferase GlmU [Kiloniellaceae bacterium]